MECDLATRPFGLLMVRLAEGRVHYAWVVFGVTFFTLLAAAGIRSTPGVLIVPLEHEFGWSRAEISLSVGINLLLRRRSGDGICRGAGR